MCDYGASAQATASSVLYEYHGELHANVLWHGIACAIACCLPPSAISATCTAQSTCTYSTKTRVSRDAVLNAHLVCYPYSVQCKLIQHPSPPRWPVCLSVYLRSSSPCQANVCVSERQQAQESGNTTGPASLLENERRKENPARQALVCFAVTDLLLLRLLYGYATPELPTSTEESYEHQHQHQHQHRRMDRTVLPVA